MRIGKRNHWPTTRTREPTFERISSTCGCARRTHWRTRCCHGICDRAATLLISQHRQIFGLSCCTAAFNLSPGLLLRPSHRTLEECCPVIPYCFRCLLPQIRRLLNMGNKPLFAINTAGKPGTLHQTTLNSFDSFKRFVRENYCAALWLHTASYCLRYWTGNNKN